MLIVNKGQNNTLVLTLTEKSTLSNPYYLVKMVNDTTRQLKTFILASDLSSYTYRYNKFTLTESNTEILTSGTVKLSPAGYWSYEVYEQSSSTNLEPANSTRMVESGKCKVIGEQVTFTPHQVNISYKAYGTGTT